MAYMVIDENVQATLEIAGTCHKFWPKSTYLSVPNVQTIAAHFLLNEHALMAAIYLLRAGVGRKRIHQALTAAAVAYRLTGAAKTWLQIVDLACPQEKPASPQPDAMSAAQNAAVRYYQEENGDYLGIDGSRTFSQDYSARAANIAGQPASVATCSVSSAFLRDHCIPVRRQDVPQEWLEAIGAEEEQHD